MFWMPWGKLGLGQGRDYVEAEQRCCLRPPRRDGKGLRF